MISHHGYIHGLQKIMFNFSGDTATRSSKKIVFINFLTQKVQIIHTTSVLSWTNKSLEFIHKVTEYFSKKICMRYDKKKMSLAKFREKRNMLLRK